jgi:hypothetical protein
MSVIRRPGELRRQGKVVVTVDSGFGSGSGHGSGVDSGFDSGFETRVDSSAGFSPDSSVMPEAE